MSEPVDLEGMWSCLGCWAWIGPFQRVGGPVRPVCPFCRSENVIERTPGTVLFVCASVAGSEGCGARGEIARGVVPCPSCGATLAQLDQMVPAAMSDRPGPVQ